MKALIVEDEKMARDNLARSISSLFPDIEVVGTSASVAETLRWLRDPSCSADIIFMDVELSDGDCFEIFRQEKVTAKVIMTTAYDSYAVKAFEAGSIDYLLKPIDPAALRRAVERCRERTSGVDLDALMRALGRSDSPAYKERFIVSVGERIIPINASDIAYFYSKDKYNYLASADGSHYIIDSSMDSLEGELDPKKFCRISRGCIVALGAVRSVTRQFGGRLRVEAEPGPPFEMTVARARVDDFLAWLG
ncbi:MAG: response regulator transcription factor [Bacteroidales bacterium]|nr:response regulator transcription factor [Bacteroidales bacterium]